MQVPRYICERIHTATPYSPILLSVGLKYFCVSVFWSGLLSQFLYPQCFFLNSTETEGFLSIEILPLWTIVCAACWCIYWFFFILSIYVSTLLASPLFYFLFPDGSYVFDFNCINSSFISILNQVELVFFWGWLGPGGNHWGGLSTGSLIILVIFDLCTYRQALSLCYHLCVFWSGGKIIVVWMVKAYCHFIIEKVNLTLL